MAVVAVTADNTRINDAESATNWSNEAGGGPAPAAEAPLKYQNSNAVNRKVASTTARQGVQYNHGSTIDMTAAANILWLVKIYVSDFADLNATWGVEVSVGSASSARYNYNIAGTGAARSVYNTYPPQGGYLITAIDPNVAGWRDSTDGSPSLTAVDHWMVACQFINGSAKAENVAMDAIDIGTGLTLVGGDGASTDGVFQDFVDEDQNTVNNRWGYATSVGSALFFRGMLTIGSATATEFTDNAAQVFFPDGYHSAGSSGVTIDLQSASTVVAIGATIVGLGSSTTEDTRPDHTVTGTSGTYTLTGTLRNHRNVTLTSACTVDGADIECADLTQSTATIQNSTLRPDTASQVAMCDDPSFTDLTDCEIVQAGSGHALEITSTGTYTLDNLTFTGFGANAANDAAIFNDSGGAVTLNVTNGGNTPTYRNGTGASTTVNNNVSITLSGLVAGSRVYIRNTTDSTDLFNEIEATTTFSDSVAYTADKSLLIRVRNASGSTKYKPFETTGTLTSSGFSLVVNQVLDE